MMRTIDVSSLPLGAWAEFDRDGRHWSGRIHQDIIYNMCYGVIVDDVELFAYANGEVFEDVTNLRVYDSEPKAEQDESVGEAERRWPNDSGMRAAFEAGVRWRQEHGGR